LTLPVIRILLACLTKTRGVLLPRFTPHRVVCERDGVQKKTARRGLISDVGPPNVNRRL
jgi:hypothetical protein